VPMHRGVTLPELIATVSIIGLVLSIAAPRLGDPLDALSVEHAASEIVAAHARARVVAVVESRITRLEVGPDSLILSVLGPDGPEQRWARPGPSRFNVTVTGSARTLTFAPTGLSMGFSNASWTLTRGGATRRVVVSRLGRLRIER